MPNNLKVGGREGSRDYGAETAIFISTLIVLYLLAVVFLVRRQITQVFYKKNFMFIIFYYQIDQAELLQ